MGPVTNIRPIIYIKVFECFVIRDKQICQANEISENENFLSVIMCFDCFVYLYNNVPP